MVTVCSCLVLSGEGILGYLVYVGILWISGARGLEGISGEGSLLGAGAGSLFIVTLSGVAGFWLSGVGILGAWCRGPAHGYLV